ncbi:MAG: type I restriction enzyme HsdR N-terminal domain-containing protein [Chitinophagales bacterium]|nr:type I restriction enzyme HsdR N-terminal domain-containing protein [Chitinophagales bacterium]MDW8417936.1 type I restriction enzyme HsdR N-terminal domain-containing protein [Chitinophagales bacterium]
MPALVNFESYAFRTQRQHGREVIYDIIRKKWVTLSPEEWVRQHVIHYLVFSKGYPRPLIAVERGFEFNGMKKRFDVVVFHRDGSPYLLVECKAPNETIGDDVLRQALGYNVSLRASYLWLSNGTSNYCFSLRPPVGEVPAIPDYIPIAKPHENPPNS